MYAVRTGAFRKPDLWGLALVTPAPHGDFHLIALPTLRRWLFGIPSGPEAWRGTPLFFWEMAKQSGKLWCSPLPSPRTMDILALPPACVTWSGMLPGSQCPPCVWCLVVLDMVEQRLSLKVSLPYPNRLTWPGMAWGTGAWESMADRKKQAPLLLKLQCRSKVPTSAQLGLPVEKALRDCPSPHPTPDRAVGAPPPD